MNTVAKLSAAPPELARQAQQIVKNLSRLSPEARKVLLGRLKANLARGDAYRKFERLYPDTGPLRRDLYNKHTSFFAAGVKQMERALMGSNRCGKSTAAAFEMVAHLTGRYPAWWRGRRFDRPITAWASGVDAKSVRETVQAALFGEDGRLGTGMLPLDLIESTTKRAGVAGAIDSGIIKHVSGGRSRVVLKSYDQGRESFQGARIDCGWCDEEPPVSVYSEFLTRLMSTVPGEPSGIMLATFTPLMGMTAVVLSFLPGGRPKEGAVNGSTSNSGGKWYTICPMDEVPHISPSERENLAASYMPHEREARLRGIPSLGAGAIYPVPESDIVVKPFELPKWYRHGYGLDVGWNRTAAVWGALDPETDILYLYSEHYRSQAEPAVHAQAIRGRGSWIPGVVDPASRGRTQTDGQQLLAIYRELGLNLTPADNAVEAGIYAVWQRLSAGRLKVFSTLENWLQEFRIYRRDEKGKVVKENDHALDATRYLVLSGLNIAVTKPATQWAQQKTRHLIDYDPAKEMWNRR
jgi:phage terminase large subunit-like protein